MQDYYLFLFATICLGLLLQVIIRPNRILEYPFFMAAIFTAFILPQAYVLYNNPELTPDDTLESVLLMCLLCVVTCWIGYQSTPGMSFMRRLNVVIDEDKFFICGIAFIMIGFFFNLLLSRVDDFGGSQWTGISTVYLLFAGLTNLGLPICLYSAIQRPRFLAFLATAISAYVPILSILAGRRAPAALFVLTMGMSLFFLKNIRIPRSVVIGGFVFMTVMIPSTIYYRTAITDGVSAYEAFTNIDLIQNFEKYLNEGNAAELRNAAYWIGATNEGGDYKLGAGYWNEMVWRYIPAQFTGKEFKEALMIGERSYEFPDEYLPAKTYLVIPGTTITGVADSYIQFGFFGCLFFYFLARLFKALWIASTVYKNQLVQIFYMMSVVQATRTVTHQTIDFLPGIFFNGIFLWLAVKYAARRKVASLVNTQS